MRLRFENLVLEITRRCNMTCAHCMRGDAQEVDMRYEVLEELFKNTGYIRRLVLTGGEPSLAWNRIESIIDLARKYGCEIGSFFCATNAKEYSLVFQTALCRLAEYCKDKEKCIFTVTTDQFHEKPLCQAIYQYRNIPFYNKVGEKKKILKTAVLNRGNATKNSIGFFDIEVPEYIFDISMDSDVSTIGDRIYINVIGDVMLDADLSYEMQAEYSIGNILERNITDVLLEKLFDSSNQPENHICKMTIIAEEGTISEEKIIYESFYKDYSKALSVFSNFVSNLHITPSPESSEVSLKAKTTFNKEFFKNGQVPAHAVIEYSDLSGTAIGTVMAAIDFVKSEDADG